MNNKPDTWRRLSSEIVADCRIFKVRRDKSECSKDAAAHDFFVLENPNWVNIIPVTTDKKVILIEQFRHGIEKLTLEIPGGMVDEGEEAEFAATRELLEETGWQPRKVVFLGKSHPNPAIQNNEVFHFLALDCEKVKETAFDTTESIETKLFPLDEIPDLIRNGEITHSLVLNAFYWYSLISEK